MDLPKWYVLVHQLPPRPLYLRAKIRNRLARVGAVAVKNSVYVLPLRDECLEDLQWIAQEAAAGGGEAFVLQAEFVTGATNAALEDRFRRQADAAYRKLTAETRRALARSESRGAKSRNPELSGVLLRLRKKHREVAATDFFEAPSQKEAEAMLKKLEGRLRRDGKPRGPVTRGHPPLSGHSWVTRRDPKVDRLASAWAVRRFVDPDARFRFIDPRVEAKRPGEIAFDMVGGDFTHEGDRCTLETLLTRLKIDDPALAAISEIVHDIDLKDGKFGRPETAGVQQLLLGLVQAHAADRDRLERGFALFDDLYAAFLGRAGARRASPPRARRTGRRRERRRS